LKLLTLTTCAELFHTDDRLVAFAVLESEEKR
jgi:sortase A